MSRKRVLALHGYHGSAELVQSQLAPLFAPFEAQLEFVAFDAPSIAAGDFGWWHGRFALWDEPFSSWDRTVDWATKLFAEEQFDGIFGFSQGAGLAGLLVGMRAADGHPTVEMPLAFDFAMMVGGFVSDEPAYAPLYESTSSYDLPSLHLTGRADGTVPIAHSLRLAGKFEAPNRLLTRQS
jgi:pimeloyl-ACP methyl ester carboxylesterase